jgi:hypothetical protein
MEAKPPKLSEAPEAMKLEWGSARLEADKHGCRGPKGRNEILKMVGSLISNKNIYRRSTITFRGETRWGIPT